MSLKQLNELVADDPELLPPLHIEKLKLDQVKNVLDCLLLTKPKCAGVILGQVRNLPNVLVKYIDKGELDLFTAALAYCTNVNAKVMTFASEKATTLLMRALSQKGANKIDFVTALLKKGANPNEISNNSSPLHEAVKSGPIELIELLLEHGAKSTLEVPAPENPFRKPQLHCDPICHLLIAGHDNVEYVAQVVNTFITRDWSPTKRTVRSFIYCLERRIASGDWTKVASSILLMNKEKHEVQYQYVIDPSKAGKSIIIKCLNIMSAVNYTGDAMAQLIEVMKIILANTTVANARNQQKYVEGYTNWVMRPIVREGIHELYPAIFCPKVRCTGMSNRGRNRQWLTKKKTMLEKTFNTALTLDPKEIPLDLLIWYHLSDGGNDKNYTYRFIHASKDKDEKQKLWRNIVTALIACNVSLDVMVHFDLSLLFPMVWSNVKCKMPFAAACLLMDDVELFEMALPCVSKETCRVQVSQDSQTKTQAFLVWVYTVMSKYNGSILPETFIKLLDHLDQLTPLYSDFLLDWHVMKLGHVLAQDGRVDLLKRMPASELSAGRQGWNAAHFAAKAAQIDALTYLVTVDRALCQAPTRQNNTVLSLVPADLGERVHELVWPKKATKKSKETSGGNEQTTTTIAELIARATANNATLLALAERIAKNEKELEQLRRGQGDATLKLN